MFQKVQEGSWKFEKFLEGSKSSQKVPEVSDTISRFLRNIHVLLDSRKKLGGQTESLHGSEGLIFMKLTKAFNGSVLPSDIISSSIRNVYVLQDSG